MSTSGDSPKSMRHDDWGATPNKDTLFSWFIAFWFALINGIEDGTFKAFGVLLITLSEQYDVKIWQVGSTASLMCFAGSAVALLVSPISKVIKPRHLMIGCGFLTSLGLICATFTTKWSIFTLIVVVFTGTGLRCTVVIMFASIHVYFDKYYALASGVISAGSAIGTMIFAVLTQMLLYRYGQAGTILILGAISLHIVFVGALMKSHKRDKDRTHKTDMPEPSKQDQRVQTNKLAFVLRLFEMDVLTNPKFLTLSSSVFGMVFGFQTWIIYIVPHAIAKGLTPYQGTALATSGCVGQLVGLFASGLLIDKDVLKERTVRLVSLLCIGFSFAIDPWCDAFVSLLLLLFLCGLGVALLHPAVVRATRNISDDTNTSVIFAYTFFVAAVGQLISGIVAGWFFDQTGSYEVSFLIVAGVEFAASFILGMEIALSDD